MDAWKYCNECLVQYEELCYEELGQAFQWKPELIGTNYIQSKNIQGNTVEEVCDAICKALKEDGLVQDIQYKRGDEGILLKLVVKGCIHLAKEAALKADNLKPYCCPIMNMFFDTVLNKLNYEITFLGGNMDIDTDKGECIVRGGIWENAEVVGEKVEDWRTI